MKIFFTAKNGRGLWYAGPTDPNLGSHIWTPHPLRRTELTEAAAHDVAMSYLGEVVEITQTERTVFQMKGEPS